jgi:hypothetical protein
MPCRASAAAIAITHDRAFAFTLAKVRLGTPRSRCMSSEYRVCAGRSRASIEIATCKSDRSFVALPLPVAYSDDSRIPNAANHGTETCCMAIWCSLSVQVESTSRSSKRPLAARRVYTANIQPSSGLSRGRRHAQSRTTTDGRLQEIFWGYATATGTKSDNRTPVQVLMRRPCEQRGASGHRKNRSLSEHRCSKQGRRTCRDVRGDRCHKTRRRRADILSGKCRGSRSSPAARQNHALPSEWRQRQSDAAGLLQLNRPAEPV